jgi:hypothetical protein
MKTLYVWILAVMLFHGGPVARMEVKSCEALREWTMSALDWRTRSKLTTNVIAVCYWENRT